LTGEVEAVLSYGVLFLILSLYVSSRIRILMDLLSEVSGESEEQGK
tara:strand:+ start:758 stop:895 length:138 start_codon:yes stop_codon:yes gene_type:complete